ncbi:MBL fold metallo-hydrolase [Sandaracinobacteroides hominis]|uniref:MBL fold metallo-hydrolase n=1 Tax=Sandaracinobacteroides hominis TaxID=2780086 RepID=UPI0018F35CCE|nr:MBL fold metallo-hydrolase [Sandaracinobacteroides hominis]
MTAIIRAFFDEPTNTVSYLVSDPSMQAAAIIDPVLDFDQPSGRISTRSADALLAAVAEGGLRLEWILETHAHADHLSAAGYLKAKSGAKLGIGARIGEVQAIFRPRFGIEGGTDGFDHLFADGERFHLGALEVEVLATPGHTPACVSYRIGDAVFVGDTLFMPDYGTARADFPGGDAATLYASIQRLLALPPETRLFMCHDYKAPGREAYRWETTVAAQRATNVHVHDGVSAEEFVAMRTARDAALAVPKLLLPSLQVNVEGGRLPPAAGDGARRMALPLTVPEGYAEA